MSTVRQGRLPRQEPPADELGPAPDDLDPHVGGIDPDAVAPAPARPLLRMLAGSNAGAECVLQGERTLVGNLESECDIVIDVSRPERHVCLIRTSTDGWTLLNVAGDLWVGEEYVEVQQTRDIASGVVATLGRVSFCIADPLLIDWSTVSVPGELVKPDPEGDVPTIALPPRTHGVQERWQAVRLAAGLGVAALVIAAAGGYLQAAWQGKPMTPAEQEARLKSEQAAVNALPYGKELRLQPVPEAPNRVVVHGFLPRQSQRDELARQLKDAGIDAELQVAAVDQIGAELSHRFTKAPPASIRYDNDGRFVIESDSARIAEHDRQARLTLQELPLLQSLGVVVADVRDESGRPLTVDYVRSRESVGEVEVKNLDVVRQRQQFVVRELRLGEFPSIVLDNGARYFEGAMLPDGTTVAHITDTEVVVRQGAGERHLPLPPELQRASIEPPAGNRRK